MKTRRYVYHKITGVIRLRKTPKENDIYIETYDYEKKDGWQKRSKILARCIFMLFHLVHNTVGQLTRNSSEFVLSHLVTEKRC